MIYDYKVSVIIPIYNTERYIQQTLLSACNQTLQNIEIICVDDGSTDKSKDIVQDQAERDPRIKIIRQLNGGLSVARNTGIVNARGKYLYFLDSDDVIESDLLEQCYHLCENENFNFVTFDSDIYNPEKLTEANGLKYNRSNCLHANVTYSGYEAFNLQLAKMDYTPSVPLLFIRSEFIKDNNLSFYPGIIHEDQIFTALLYLKAQKVGYIPKQLFHRRIRFNSTMTSKFSWKNVHGYLTATDVLIRSKKQFSPEAGLLIDILLSQTLDSIIHWQAYKLPKDERISLTVICLHRYMKYIRYRSIFYLFLKSIFKKKAQ